MSSYIELEVVGERGDLLQLSRHDSTPEHPVAREAHGSENRARRLASRVWRSAGSRERSVPETTKGADRSAPSSSVVDVSFETSSPQSATQVPATHDPASQRFATPVMSQLAPTATTERRVIASSMVVASLTPP